MVICLFVGCMCSPCVRSRTPVKTFRKPMGNSLVLLQAIRDLFPSWDVSAEQALRAWILSMPSSIRARLDVLSLEELQQLSGASPPPPATATVYTQTVRLFMPRSPARSLLTSFDTTEPQHSVFTTTEATSSTASMLSVFGNAQASLSAPPRPSFAVTAAQQPRPAAPRPTFAASQPGLAAVRRSLVSQRSLVFAPHPTPGTNVEKATFRRQVMSSLSLPVNFFY